MMRFIVACAGLVALVGVASAQAPAPRAKPDPKTITFRGDRFKPLTWDTMTPEQRTMLEHIFAGPRASADGPFNVLLRSPVMGDLAQQFGASMRFNRDIPRRLNEMAIIITGRYWTAQYEWVAHKRAALQAGLSPAIVDAIQNGKRPTGMTTDETAVYDFCTELLRTKQVSDATFDAAKAAVGEKGVVDLIGVMGWYQMVSMMLNVDRYPLPAGVQPELKPLD
jgi:4-carboxymuconolactone decarboxylase